MVFLEVNLETDRNDVYKICPIGNIRGVVR